MKNLRLVLVASACLLSFAASAQWQWLDQNGKKVFSDRPPPADIPQSRIVKQPPDAPPRPAADAAAPAAAGAPTAAASAAAPKISGKDSDLEAKKKAMAKADADKKVADRKAEEEKIAASRADNCMRAKKDKSAFDSGMRMARVNDKGEREVLEDKQRAEEVARLQAVIDRDCK